MKKLHVQLICLLSAVLIFTLAFIYGLGKINALSELSLSEDYVVLTENEQELEQIDYDIELLRPLVASEPLFEVSEEEPKEEVTPEPPATPAPEQIAKIDASVTVSATPEIFVQEGAGTTIIDTPSVDTQPNTPTSSQGGTTTSSQGTSQGTAPSPPASQSTRSALDSVLGMPEYTPSGITLSVTFGGTQYKADAVTVLSGMVQCEIVGAANEAPISAYNEAYKAQAVAAHSYVKYSNLRSSAPSVSMKTPNAQTVRLVEQVAGKLVYYNGSVAQTVYHASSGGHTQSAAYVWGSSVPYLVGVESKYDNSLVTTTYTLAQMKSKLASCGITPSGDPSGWFSIVNYTDGYYVNAINICGVQKTGRYVRETLLGYGIRSPKFSVTYSNETFTFITNGYGHGVGMSQIGAKGYAKNEGMSYVQILQHYYKGCTVG